VIWSSKTFLVVLVPGMRLSCFRARWGAMRAALRAHRAGCAGRLQGGCAELLRARAVERSAGQRAQERCERRWLPDMGRRPLDAVRRDPRSAIRVRRSMPRLRVSNRNAEGL
jgi:hypothetical protein